MVMNCFDPALESAPAFQFFHIMHDGIALLSLEADVPIYVNPALAKMHGYSVEEFRQLSPWQMIHPAFHQQFEENLAAVMRGEEISAETLDLHRDGSAFWVETSPSLYQTGGKTLVLFVVRDVSDRKQREAEALIQESLAAKRLQDNEAKLRAVISTAPIVLFAFDHAGVFTFSDGKGLEALGVEPQSSVGLSLFDAYGHLEQVTEAVRGCLGGHPTSSVTQMGHLWFESRYMPTFDDDGQVNGGIGISLDITASRNSQVQLEQALENLQHAQVQLVQQEKMSSLGQLVAGVAHEINNPTNFIYANISCATDYIQGLVRLLEMYRQYYPQPPKNILEEIEALDLDFVLVDLPHLLGSIQTGAERIKQIVLSLRNFARMDESEFKLVDVHEGLESALVILAHRLKANEWRSQIEIQLSYSHIPLVNCFAGQLNQVFINILSNGIDAIEAHCRTLNGDPHFQPRLFVQTAQVQDSAGQDLVEIRIQDNGCGIDSSLLSRLFDPFFTTKPVGQGTGLGLSISYQIVVDRHKGSLRCESILGQGSEFIITFPVKLELAKPFT
jgi:PAS domain S-box-containing protein